MRRLRGGVALVLCAVVVAGLTMTTAAAAPGLPVPPTAVRPRLLFSPADVAGYRARFADATQVPGQAMQRVTEKAEHHLLTVFPDVVRAGTTIDPFNITHDAERPYNLQNEMPTYLIELGFAYQMSGDTPAQRDARFGRRAIDLVSALGDKNFPYWSWQDLGIGDLDEGLALAVDMTWELMTPIERIKIIGDIVRMQDHLLKRPLLAPWNAFANNLNNSNWMGVTTGGAGLLLLTLQGLPGVPTSWYDVDPATPVTYWEKALERIADFLHHSVDPAGANEEGLTYAVYGLKNAIPFAKALERAGYGDQFAGTGLPKLSRWMALEQLPGEGQNYVPLNDSQRTMYGVDVFAQWFAINPADGVGQWLWRRTVGPLGDDYYREPHVPYVLREDKCDRPFELVSLAACDLYQFHGNVWAALWYRTPAETPEVDPELVGALSVHHAKRGLVDARTGFSGGTHEAVSTFEARRDGWPHYQYDLGGFTLYGEGGRWAIDPGYSCVACKKSRDQMNAVERAQDEDGAYATFHNVVVIDNDTYTQKHGSRFNIVNDRSTEADDLKTIDSFVDAPNLSLAHADLRYAYEFAAPYAGRDHFFSRVPGRPVLLGITDQVKRDAGNHRYRWQMITNNDNQVATSGPRFTITHGWGGATLVGQTAADAAPTADPVVQTDARLFRNPTDDEGKLMPVVFTESAAQPTMEHMAFMALTPAGAPPATTDTIRVDGGNAIGITWNGVQDVLVRRVVGAAAVTGVIATDADVAKFTREGAETVARAATQLTAYGRDYVRVTGTRATVTVSGGRIAATGGAPTNRYVVFAPGEAQSVTVDGAPVYSCRSGDYVAFPCPRPTTLTYTGPTNAIGSRVTVTGTLADNEARPLAGQTVGVAVGTVTATAVTDGSGRLTATLEVADHGRSQPVVLTYAGTSVYGPSTATATIRWGLSP
ncbi:MAG TPA: Ig-like domain-containing protein [Acidimicrobiales bacterium]|nr:Ig-like domain-containing protein [Acidimicrobiales bacterium]